MPEFIFGKITDGASKRLSDGILELARISAVLPQAGSVIVPLIVYNNGERNVVGKAELHFD
jgi:hypothetical protein